jgi:hypothetical protein
MTLNSDHSLTFDWFSLILIFDVLMENKVLVDIFIFGFATVLIISHVKYALHYALNFVSMDTTKVGTKQKILKSL